MYDNDELLMLLDDDLFPVEREEGDDNRWHGIRRKRQQSIIGLTERKVKMAYNQYFNTPYPYQIPYYQQTIQQMEQG